MNRTSVNILVAQEEAYRCLLCHDAPCSKACPSLSKPDRFIRALRFQNVDGAIRIIRENNYLGATCAELCTAEKLCEKACIRNKIDSPVQIKKLHKYLMDKEKGEMIKSSCDKPLNKIAVIASDIKGVAICNSLLKNNYSVELYSDVKIEAFFDEYIQNGELREDSLKRDLAFIEKKGLKFNHYIPSGSQLLEGNYQAIIASEAIVGDMQLKELTSDNKVYYIDEMIKDREGFIFKIADGNAIAKKVLSDLDQRMEAICYA